MSERKVLNKYYPPDFDPSAIPKMRFPKNRTFNIRIMAPFNMRCNTCGGYIYKGKKFNSRKENVDEEFYLGLRIFRFYIKCPTCVAEIAFKTDLKNTDYTLEAGATRLFEAEKLAKEMAEKEIKDKEEEELNNPMKVLENRTKASRNEIEQIDTLEELREMSARQAKVDTETMLLQHKEYEEQLQRLQEEEEEKEIRAIFGEKQDGKVLKRLKDDSDGDDQPETKKMSFPEKATDIFASADKANTLKQTGKNEVKKTATWQRSVGGFSNKGGLKNLVKKKEQKNASIGIDSNGGSTPTHSASVGSLDKSTDTSHSVTNSTLPLVQSQLDADKNVIAETNNSATPSSSAGPSSSGSSAVTPGPMSSSSLGLLVGTYSDSDESE